MLKRRGVHGSSFFGGKICASSAKGERIIRQQPSENHVSIVRFNFWLKNNSNSRKTIKHQKTLIILKGCWRTLSHPPCLVGIRTTRQKGRRHPVTDHHPLLQIFKLLKQASTGLYVRQNLSSGKPCARNHAGLEANS